MAREKLVKMKCKTERKRKEREWKKVDGVMRDIIHCKQGTYGGKTTTKGDKRGHRKEEEKEEEEVEKGRRRRSGHQLIVGVKP